MFFGELNKFQLQEAFVKMCPDLRKKLHFLISQPINIRLFGLIKKFYKIVFITYDNNLVYLEQAEFSTKSFSFLFEPKAATFYRTLYIQKE